MGSVPKNTVFYNYSNPFNPKTDICFYTKDIVSENIFVSIYNVKGEFINKVYPTFISKDNKYHFVWNGNTLMKTKCSSGIYFAVLRYSNKKFIRKMILIK